MLKTDDKNVATLSRELGIADQIIYRWNKKYNLDDKKEIEKVTDQDKEIRELRAKLADVTEKPDILKKAVSIFSKQGNSK